MPSIHERERKARHGHYALSCGISRNHLHQSADDLQQNYDDLQQSADDLLQNYDDPQRLVPIDTSPRDI
ncbi:MAG TPA: hypothetical protein DCL18_02785 [Prevotella sp.]|nr:hypothetical protein [Prevotella sp.]